MVQKEGKTLAEQNVIARRFAEEDYLRLMADAGFANVGKDVSGNLLLFQKA